MSALWGLVSRGGLFAALFFTAVLLGAQTEHTIQRGETLYGIARTYGVSLEILQTANEITDPGRIRVGQKIIIPSATGQSGSDANRTSAVALSRYTVAAGDTLYGVARRFGMTLQSLLIANNLQETNVLRVGQVLLVADQSGETSPIRLTPSPSPRPSVEAVPQGSALSTVAFNQGGDLLWPSPGDRYTTQGKLPGIMIRAKQGEVVRSVSTGRVVYSGPHSTLGFIVMVQGKNGYVYIYGGNEGSQLKTGAAVKIGDTIGTVGITPGVQESQVYFSVWKDGVYLNPVQAPRE